MFSKKTRKNVSFLLALMVFSTTFSTLVPEALADSTAVCSQTVDVVAGQTATWTATISGSPTPSISWSGDEGLSGSGTTATVTYTTDGTKTGTVTATASGSSTSVSCSDIVISVSLTPAPTPAPTATLTVDSSSITSGDSTNLNWSSTDATSCTGTNFDTASATSGSVSTGALTADQTYSVTCTGPTAPDATATAGVTVTSGGGTPAPTATLTASSTSVTSGGSTNLTWTSTDATSCVGTNFDAASATSGSFSTGALTSDTTYSVTCTGPTAPDATATQVITVTSGGGGGTPAPTATLTASPTSVTSGGTSTLTWSSTDATSCTGTNFDTASATSGSTTTPALTADQTYSVTCTGPTAPDATATAGVTVGAPICPIPSITSTLTASVVKGATFSYTLSATTSPATTTPIVYNIDTGSLPAGLSVSGNVISGIPTQIGTFNIALTASNTCGATNQNLVLTVTSPPTGGGGGGGGTTRLIITNERIEEIIPGVVFIRWDTNISATRRVVYGQPAVSALGLSPNYGYDASTVELASPLLTSHGMAVVGLTPGETYHFRPVSTNGSLLAVGDELTFVPAGGGTGGGCDYLFDYLKIGFENDPVEVRKLQIFLRDLEGFSNLAVTGFFDQTTFDAVSAFQLRYQDDILTPWGYQGTSTGFVYILTKKKVNEIYCKFAFPVTIAQQSEIDAYRTFLESLQREGVPTGGTAPIESVPTTPNILETGAQIGQLPTTEQVQSTTTLVLNTATTSPTEGVLRNLAAAVLALPETTGEAFDCIYKLIVVLLGLYLLSLLIVAMFDNGMSYRKIVSFRIMSLILGIIVAVPVSIVLLAYCLVIPLLVVLIILAGFLLWYVNKKDDDDTPLPPSDVVDSPPTIFPPTE